MTRTFTLPNGFTVSVTRTAAELEFVTSNTASEVISTVRRSFAESYPLLQRLACRTR